MITVEELAIILHCSVMTARRKIAEMYEKEKIDCPEKSCIPLSMVMKHKGITKEDIEWAVNRRIA